MGQSRGVAARLEHVFEVVRNPSTGEPYTNAEVARMTLGDLSEEDVEKIRSGAVTAFLEKGEPLRERSPQHSVSTKGLGPCASQPGGPFSSRTAVGGPQAPRAAPQTTSPATRRAKRWRGGLSRRLLDPVPLPRLSQPCSTTQPAP